MIQRNRDCQPSEALCESYCTLFVTAMNGENCISPTSLYRLVVKSPSRSLTSFHWPVRKKNSPGRTRMMTFIYCTVHVPEQNYPISSDPLIDSARLLPVDTNSRERWNVYAAPIRS